jgi:hypothetical protein
MSKKLLSLFVGLSLAWLGGATATPAPTPSPTPDEDACVVTIHEAAHGTVTGSGSGTYHTGDAVSFLAVPDAGYVFGGWDAVGDGKAQSIPASINPYAGTLLKNHAKVIDFTPIFTIAAEPTPPPTPTPEPTATPIENPDPTPTPEPTATPPATPSPTPIEGGFILTVTQSEHGSVTDVSGPYHALDKVTLTATPESGYELANWIYLYGPGGGSPDQFPPTNPLEFVVPAKAPYASITIMPVFAPKEPGSVPDESPTPAPTVLTGSAAKPHIDLGSKGGNDGRFFTKKSVGVIKGICSPGVDIVAWKMGKRSGKTRVGADGSWTLRIKSLEPGMNSLLIWGVDRKTGRKTDPHRSVIVWLAD